MPNEDIPQSGTPPPARALTLPTSLKIIALGQVWGAATGTWLVLQIFRSNAFAASPLGTELVLGFLLAFYTLSGASALLVLRGRERAVFYLAAAQIPQLVHLQTPHFLYAVISGVYGVVRAGGGTGGINFGIMSTFSVRWGDLDVSTGIGVNVVAAATLWYLTLGYPSSPAEALCLPLRSPDQLGEAGPSSPAQ